ncbi:hypothetical protein BDN72DRAFT_835842 [Pluteus cervinus]|uniref:Uncharacterized protein n=1 Tax=Pluteus cervinus TaxID=181527 RepID=A0ACD3B3V9_9AGAR|nr:hypothetical protein BDN72DRAFT_835842 [Pluteus cervinus]
MAMGRTKRARKAPAKRLTNTSSSLGESEELSYPGVDYFTQLPTELLSEIAKYVHMDAVRRVEHPIVNLTEQPLKHALSLAAISRRLRSIFTREPSLWSYIRINTRYTNEAAIIACLERSGNHPLSILWIGEGSIIPETQLVKMIVKHSQRWISFALVSPITGYLCLFMEDPFWNVNAPILKRFYVASTVPDGEEEEDYFGEDCFNFPSIQHIKLYRYPFPTANTSMKTLTRLELDASNGNQLSFEQLALVAKNSVHIEHLNLHQVLDSVSGAPGLTRRQDRITWPSLLQLVIYSETTSPRVYIWRYLELFRVPKLQKFVAISPDTNDFKIDNPDASRIAANIPLVKEVTIICPHIDATAGRKLFIYFPHITHFALCDYPCDGHKPAFNSFFYPNALSNTKIWPNLESITLGYVQNKKLLRNIANCLYTRRKNGRPVAKIIIPRGQSLMTGELKVAQANLVQVTDIMAHADYNFKPR